jgi:tRNA(Ile2) C34 agmatinyltransferase TiaS
MIEKRKTCLYCGGEMESLTAKKKFCSDLHRLYYNRELKRGTLELPKVNEPALSRIETESKSQDHQTIPTFLQKPPRMEGESGIDYSIRIADWKNKKP